VLLVSSLHGGEAWQACAQQTEKSHSHTTKAVEPEPTLFWMAGAGAKHF